MTTTMVVVTTMIDEDGDDDYLGRVFQIHAVRSFSNGIDVAAMVYIGYTHVYAVRNQNQKLFI